MFRIFSYFLLAHALIAADGIYTIGNPCAPARCTATVMNERGDIAEQIFDNGSGPDGRGFEILDGRLIQPLNPLGARGDYVLPNWINISGVLAVEFGSYLAPSAAGLYLPASGTLLNLNTARSWAGPATALTVNDSGDVAAISTNFNDLNPYNPVFGTSGYFFAFLNNRVVIQSPNLTEGNGSAFDLHGMIWSIFSPSGTVSDSKQVLAYSSGGHVLQTDFGDFGLVSFYIYTPGKGRRQLAGLKLHPFAINDKDELLLRGTTDDYVWDQLSPPRRLQDLLDPGLGIPIVRGIAINNAGQILVEAGTGIGTSYRTSLILSPRL